MSKIKILLIMLSSIYFIVNCTQTLPQSIGKIRQIIVLTNFRSQIEKQLQYTLQRNYYTVQPEPEFILRYEDLSRLSDFMKFHLILIVGVISEEPIQTLLKEYQTKIQQDSFGLYSYNDIWAKNQKVFIFATNNYNVLPEGLKRYERRIRQEFQNYLINYLTELTYARGYKKEITDSLINHYHYSIKVPHSFFLNTKYENNNFIYLVAHNPTRSIFIYNEQRYIELDPSYIISLRDSITNLFFDKDYVYQPLTYAETTNFNNNIALKLIGAWQNDALTAGGPFISYCFNKNDHFYYIDGSVFNPGKRKLDNLLQLDAIIRTFEILQ